MRELENKEQNRSVVINEMWKMILKKKVLKSFVIDEDIRGEGCEMVVVKK